MYIDYGDKEVENRGKTDKDNQKEHKEGTRSSGDDDRSKDERRDRRDDRRDNRRDDRREDRRDDRRDERRRDDRRDDTRRDDRRDRRDDRKDYKRDREERETGFSKGNYPSTLFHLILSSIPLHFVWLLIMYCRWE